MKLPKYNLGFNIWDQLRSLTTSASKRKHHRERLCTKNSLCAFEPGGFSKIMFVQMFPLLKLLLQIFPYLFKFDSFKEGGLSVEAVF